MGGIIKGIFGGGKKTPQPAAPAKPAPVAVMPTPDDEAIRKARSRRAAAVMQRSGRASTILSDSGERLGG